MKVIRRILLIVILIILIIIGIGFTLPRNVSIERSIVINASKDLVFQQINNLQQWKLWSPWLIIDSTVVMEFSGPEAGSGAALSYQSANNNMGSGKLLITASFPSDSIILDMDFLDDGNATGKFIFTQVDSGTFVKWIVESDLGTNPISRWFGVFMEPMAGKDFEQGLANLSELALRIPATPIIAVFEKEIPARFVLSIRDTASPYTITSKLTDYYSDISDLIRKKKLNITGVPFSVYYKYTPDSYDIEAGIPVHRLISLNGQIKSQQYPACRVVMASYYGAYESTAIAYDAIEKYIKEKDLTISGSPWEEYITDPSLEPDTSKWQTDVFYPIK